MKKIGLFLLLAVFSLGYVSAQDAAKVPAAEFDKTTHEFGKIAEEIKQATCVFEVTNTGDAPLIINKIGVQCGCTTPSYSKEPILPGKKGEIKIAYTTTNRIGSFKKSVTVFTNVPDKTYTLYIQGEVLPRK